MRTPIEITPTVHLEGDEFRLNIIEDGRKPDECHWRIVVKNGVFQIVLFDQRGDYRGFQIERRGNQFDIYQNRDVRL